MAETKCKHKSSLGVNLAGLEFGSSLLLTLNQFNKSNFSVFYLTFQPTDTYRVKGSQVFTGNKLRLHPPGYF